jgi:hypothetical protein
MVAIKMLFEGLVSGDPALGTDLPVAWSLAPTELASNDLAIFLV